MQDQVSEIRINKQYVQCTQADYPNTLKGDSIATIRKHLCQTSKYISKMESSIKGMKDVVLPPNCRYIEKVADHTIVVIEEPPALRTIKVDYGMCYELERLQIEGKIKEWNIDEDYYKDPKNKPFKFTLAFPYVVFILVFDRYYSLNGGQVFLRNARISGLSDYLLKIPMLNIDSEQYVCFGDKGYGNYRSLSSSIENAVMVFWSASFNSDFTYNYDDYLSVPIVNSYIEWQAMSQINPMFIYNVDWIRHKRTLNEAISDIKRNFRLEKDASLGYKDLEEIFTRSVDTGLTSTINKNNKTKLELYYDIAQGIYLNNSVFVHVGDPCLWGNHIAHIESFVGFYESDAIKYIRLAFNGRSINVKFTQDVSDYLLAGVTHLRFQQQGTLKNGAIIKPDDIVCININNNELYKKVQYIRRAQDGLTEAKLGNSFYILENVEGKKLDIIKPLYYGVELKKDEKYIYFTNGNENITKYGYECEFDSIDVSPDGKLLANLYGTASNIRKSEQLRQVTINGPNVNVSEDLQHKNLFKITELKPLPPVFRIGKRLFSYNKSYAYGMPNGTILGPNFNSTYLQQKYVIENIIINNGNTFRLDSFDLDIIFNVGDKVVVADWETPSEMLKVKTITAFEFNKRSGDVDFVLSDKDSKLTKIPYVIGIGVNRITIASIGKIRKITNSFNGVNSGSKIVAEKGHIPQFPKKDVNIIIGFITDTGGSDPLVLCSNCCTLWFSDMISNFDIIPMSSEKWSKLQHSPIDISKIKMQPGDIISDPHSYESHIICLSKYGVSKVLNMTDFSSYHDLYTIDRYIKNNMSLNCIINPRISTKEVKGLPIHRGLPNLHGGISKNELSGMYFPVDGRSFNV